MDDIIKLFTKNHGIYNTVLKFRTIVFFIIVLILITKTEIINKSTFLLVCIVFSLYLSNLYVNINNYDLNDNNTDARSRRLNPARASPLAPARRGLSSRIVLRRGA